MLLTFDALVNVKQQMFVAAANSFLPPLSFLLYYQTYQSRQITRSSHRSFFYFFSMFFSFCSFDYHCACCFLNYHLETLKIIWGVMQIPCYMVDRNMLFFFFWYQWRKNIFSESKGNCEFSEQRLMAITNANYTFWSDWHMATSPVRPPGKGLFPSSFLFISAHQVVITYN